jgi:hypothetical protein
VADGGLSPSPFFCQNDGCRPWLEDIFGCWGRSGARSLALEQAADTAHTGIRVQILDGKTAQPIPGYTWAEAAPISDISELVDKPIRIEIAMRESELFAIRTKCQAFYAVKALPTLW